MNNQVLAVKPLPALLLLGGEYVLLGWYLAAHHIFWLLGTLILLLTFTVIWKKNPILDSLLWLARQEVVVAIGLSLVLSLIVALAFIKPILLSLVLLPLATLLYAIMEMRATEFTQTDVLIWTIMITTFSLGLGEAIDLFITPSMRY
ncbi:MULTISPECIES: hypothetical protein [unclassified Leptolyngbya]|uniref:hypothetical protein n=1 Tax=unclassified Leptolyngbya TaxID=2650499 RepID=UPI001682C5AD|nr:MULTISPECIES: hypothetical protein [unclassified Leptolyngbya]MBD1909733.1 hypothetical protein [Leptolyngbya sp. FACHB-8]MBD2156313.1 hypothetical protein [Leptolyngbya sp. FACHB-16]